MFLASSAILALAVASVSAHSIHHVRRHHVPRAQPPPGWATGYLEDYDTYHTRYMAVGCENKHNTTFFDFCCHPMLATETLAKNRPACCAPGSTAQCPSTSSSAETPTSTSTDDEDCDDDDGDDGENNTDDDDEDCDDEDGSSTIASTKVASSTPTAVSSGSNDDDDEDCEDDDDDDASATKVPTSTHAIVSPASTHFSHKAAPTTTDTTPKAPTTSTAETSTKTASSSSSGLGDMITGGFGTWFTQNGVAGACGTVHKDTDYVVALPTVAYDKGANCGRKVKIYDVASGKSVDALVADECPTCDNNECLDMSVSLFEAFHALSVGEFSIKYQFFD